MAVDGRENHRQLGVSGSFLDGRKNYGQVGTSDSFLVFSFLSTRKVHLSASNLNRLYQGLHVRASGWSSKCWYELM